MQAAYGGGFSRVEENWVHSLSLVDSVKLGEDERPLPEKHIQAERCNHKFCFQFCISWIHLQKNIFFFI